MFRSLWCKSIHCRGVDPGDTGYGADYRSLLPGVGWIVILRMNGRSEPA